jgi:hypothetical protein
MGLGRRKETEGGEIRSLFPVVLSNVLALKRGVFLYAPVHSRLVSSSSTPAIPAEFTLLPSDLVFSYDSYSTRLLEIIKMMTSLLNSSFASFYINRLVNSSRLLLSSELSFFIYLYIYIYIFSF